MVTEGRPVIPLSGRQRQNPLFCRCATRARLALRPTPASEIFGGEQISPLLSPICHRSGIHASGHLQQRYARKMTFPY